MITVRRRTVLVNLVDGRTTISGQRRLSWPWQVKVTGASLHRGPDDARPVDGAVLIPRHRVDFIQVVS